MTKPRRSATETRPEQRQAWHRAAREILTPVAAALLRNGIGYREMVAILGEAVAQAALAGGDLSDEALACSTGLPRGSVRKLRQGATEAAGPCLSYACATRLIGRWRSDPRFGKRGRPHVLPLHGDASFDTLCAMADVDPENALNGLTRARLARLSTNGIELIADAYVPVSGETEKLDILGRDGAEFLQAMIHNVSAKSGRTMLQRKASYDNIGARSVSKLREALRGEATRALQAADRALSECDRDRSPGAPSGARTRISFGVYVTEDRVSGRAAASRGRGRRR